jgi:hypothetical protein
MSSGVHAFSPSDIVPFALPTRAQPSALTSSADGCHGRGQPDDNGSCHCAVGAHEGMTDLYCHARHRGNAAHNRECCPLRRTANENIDGSRAPRLLSCALATLIHVQPPAAGERGHARTPLDDYGARQTCAALALFHSYNTTNRVACEPVLLTDDSLSAADAHALETHGVRVLRLSLPPQHRPTVHTHFDVANSLKLHLAGCVP